MSKLISTKIKQLDLDTRDRVIRAAWEDDVSFESIKMQYGLSEDETISLMKSVMKPKMFVIWRTRVRGRDTKHFKKMHYSDTYEFSN